MWRRGDTAVGERLMSTAPIAWFSESPDVTVSVFADVASVSVFDLPSVLGGALFRGALLLVFSSAFPSIVMVLSLIPALTLVPRLFFFKQMQMLQLVDEAQEYRARHTVLCERRYQYAGEAYIAPRFCF